MSADVQPRADDRSVIVGVRTVLHSQRQRASAANIAYTIYTLVLLLLVVVVPLSRSIMVGLAQTDGFVVTALTSPSPSPELVLVLVLASLGVLALGKLYGPVIPPEPFTWFVLSGPLTRSVALARFFARSCAWMLLAGMLFTAIAVGASAVAGRADLAGSLMFFVSSALFLLQLGALWLVGQVGGALRLRVIAVLLVIAVSLVALVLFPAVTGLAEWVELCGWLGPWGWLVTTWHAAEGGVTVETVIAAGLLVASTLLLLSWSVSLLNRLRAESLITQASSWSIVGVFVSTGDLRSAAERLRSPPRIGRNWSVWFPGKPLPAVVVRDLVGIARFPVRGVLAVLGLCLYGVLLAYCFAGLPAAGLLIYIGPLVAYGSLGALSSGLRIHAASIGLCSPFGWGLRRQTLLHLVVPACCAIVFSAAGVLLGFHVVGAGNLWSADTPWIALTWGSALAVFFVVAQLFSALKGVLPPELLAPVPTPLGDLSIVNVMIWLADAHLAVLVVGGLLTALLLAESSLLIPLVLLALSVTLLLGRSEVRLRRLLPPVG